MIKQKLKYKWVLPLIAVLMLAPYAIADEEHEHADDKVIEEPMDMDMEDHHDNEDGHHAEEETEHMDMDMEEEHHDNEDGHHAEEETEHMDMEEEHHMDMGMEEDDHSAHAHSKDSFEEYGLVKSEPGYKEFNIKLSRFSFTPQSLKVDKGDIVKLNLDSTDVEHGFFIDAYGVNLTVPEKGFTTIEFVANKRGAFRIRCASTCGSFHAFMIAKLVVGSNHVFWAAVMGIVFLPAGSLAYAVKKQKNKKYGAENE